MKRGTPCRLCGSPSRNNPCWWPKKRKGAACPGAVDLMVEQRKRLDRRDNWCLFVIILSLSIVYFSLWWPAL